MHEKSAIELEACIGLLQALGESGGVIKPCESPFEIIDNRHADSAMEARMPDQISNGVATWLLK